MPAACFIASANFLPALRPAEVTDAFTPLFSFVLNALRFGSTSIHAAVPAIPSPHQSLFSRRLYERHQFGPLLRLNLLVHRLHRCRFLRQ